MVTLRFTLAAVLLQVASLTLAHGEDEDHGMDLDGLKSPAEHKGNGLPDYYAMPSYAGSGSHGKMMLAHIILMVLAWLFVLPFGTSVRLRERKTTHNR